jgi:CheY-like chemotaxis protein
MMPSLLEQTEYLDDGLWRWSIRLSPQMPLSDVIEVVYTLHPTFTKPVRRVETPEGGFAIEDLTSCPFTVFARVVFRDGAECLLEKTLELTPRPLSSTVVQATARKPVIVVVDDVPEVLRAIARDVRQKYGDEYDVRSFESGVAGLKYLRDAKTQYNEIAVILSDMRMPGMDGVTFLAEAGRLQPQAMRALLTAYADVDAAIAALNAGVNAYLTKPWDPPAQNLYPKLDELIAQWRWTKGTLSVTDSMRTKVL